MTITRAGDFWLIDDERVPVFTECAGQILEWEHDNDTLVSRCGTWDLTVGWVRIGWEIARGHQHLSGTESTVVLAQRRCLRALEARVRKMEEV